MFSWCWTVFHWFNWDQPRRYHRVPCAPLVSLVKSDDHSVLSRLSLGWQNLSAENGDISVIGYPFAWAASVGRAKSVASVGPWGLMTPPNGPLPVALCSLVMQPGSSGWYQQLWLALGMENKVCKQWLTLRVDSLLHFFSVKDHQLGIPRHFWIAIGRLKR